jgi:predicted  nucleic acid-binding Zn-ribbon protein
LLKHVAATSALVRGVIQMQRTHRQELSQANKHAANLQHQLEEAQTSLRQQEQQLAAITVQAARVNLSLA